MKVGISRISVLGAILALVAGCATSGAGETTTTAASPDTTEAPVTTTVPDDEGTGDEGVGAPNAECLEAGDAMTSAMESFGSSMTGAFTSENMEQVADQLEAMAAAAPDEIRDDFEVLARELGPFYEALGEIGLTPGAQPTPDQIAALAAASEGVDQVALQEASSNLEAWFADNC
jgi:type IV pilus biogenesis protein CpaD/CtpE